MRIFNNDKYIGASWYQKFCETANFTKRDLWDKRIDDVKHWHVSVNNSALLLLLLFYFVDEIHPRCVKINLLKNYNKGNQMKKKPIYDLKSQK